MAELNPSFAPLASGPNDVPMTTQVFVYGTLKPGHAAYDTFCKPWPHKCHAAIVAGTLYDLAIGYPVMVLDGQNQLTPAAPDQPLAARHQAIVQGYVIQFDHPDVLSHLDDYEQHDPAEMAQFYPDIPLATVNYRRVKVPTYQPDRRPLMAAWAYIMTSDQAQRLKGKPIVSGNWDDR
ncbi:gamma-glutamylcyclotransferase [filamentous cyanobacterium LEGE 11480]|uniref:Gamma-glutamylcyclotransferase n=1 Tax=Romeriopsis navalis LEGE 11480 TaxID=2777977 RepID=A0A928VP81_9CYAN|nr:gamma-glutamylcyclotransferase family protein [Romeriopsis navalis]MBE9031298.1 gamma-glutamylcyclotransferase [Romeriopsis navalis LEGE 11480]